MEDAAKICHITFCFKPHRPDTASSATPRQEHFFIKIITQKSVMSEVPTCLQAGCGLVPDSQQVSPAIILDQKTILLHLCSGLNLKDPLELSVASASGVFDATLAALAIVR